MHRLSAYLRTHHIGLLALFIALGGTSYAATRNSVGSTQLKKNAVTSPKVKDHSLLAQDFKAGQLPAGLAGSKGDPGPKGDAGAAGAKGAAGVAGAKGDPGTNGTDGTNGTNGTARAYGRVSGTVVTRSKNVVSVTNPSAGQFCITLDASIDGSTTGAVAMPDFSGDATGMGVNTGQAWAEFRSGGVCAASQIEIITGLRTVTAVGSADADVHSITMAMVNQPFFFVVP